MWISTLHSNMVLFKSVISLHSRIVVSFTFQYGSIQIQMLSHPFYHAFNFTFQYGSIQIEADQGYVDIIKDFTFQYGSIQIVNKCSIFKFVELYIPIWFYSNSSFHLLHRLIQVLYIPIWFYSNFEFHILHFLSKCFTFQYGSIQITTMGNVVEVQYTLHSNMVLFK